MLDPLIYPINPSFPLPGIMIYLGEWWILYLCVWSDSMIFHCCYSSPHLLTFVSLLAWYLWPRKEEGRRAAASHCRVEKSWWSLDGGCLVLPHARGKRVRAGQGWRGGAELGWKCINNLCLHLSIFFRSWTTSNLLSTAGRCDQSLDACVRACVRVHSHRAPPVTLANLVLSCCKGEMDMGKTRFQSAVYPFH